MMEKVSICVPCYNSEKYLQETVESILGQTHKDIELILADDGSTDRTRAMIANYQLEDSRIKPLYLEHTGNIGLTFKKGLAIATGQYCMDFGSDDILERNAVEELLTVFRQDDSLGLVYSGYTWFKDKTYEVIRQTPHPDNKAYHYEPNKLLLYNYIAPPNMYKKIYYDKVGGFSESYSSAEDYDLYLRLEEVCKFAQLKGKFLCRYRQRASSVSNAKAQIVEANAQRARASARVRRESNGRQSL